MDAIVNEGKAFLLVSVVGDGTRGAPDVLPDAGASGTGEFFHAVRDFLGAREAFETHKVGGEAGYVGRSCEGDVNIITQQHGIESRTTHPLRYH